MTRLFNDPSAFADEMIEGFARAHRRWVTPTTGGVIAADRTEGAVALVIGGGSGHYPAFGGLVGPGLAAGAAMGNVFASPSTQQVHAVARHAHSGGGVLLSYGNYAGDVLNFDLAQDRLRANGIQCETVVVTDDIASAPASTPELRRGIAGDLVVFKVAGAAIAEGATLAEAAAVARHANDRTRTLGVAFSGCTLPGAGAPLFDVPAGRMAIGLGIHGEPGLEEVEVPTADELARLLVDRLVAETPAGSGNRVAVILNGLGSVKYEELFVLYRAIGALLEQQGLEVVEPEVGEFCTSFDMAGVSLTLVWLDAELERLWSAPCDTPAFRKGAVNSSRGTAAVDSFIDDELIAVAESTAQSRDLAALISSATDDVARVIDGAADELGRLDSIAGDGDHGIGMQRGVTAAAHAARDAVTAGAGARSTLTAASAAWSDKAGGTSGALWGLAIAAVAARLDDGSVPTDAAVAAGVAEALDRIVEFGKAQLGDKTMVDAFAPFSARLTEGVAAGEPLAMAWRGASRVADIAARATADIPARRGRARTHGDASLGAPDPGAVSFALIVATIGDHLERTRT